MVYFRKSNAHFPIVGGGIGAILALLFAPKSTNALEIGTDVKSALKTLKSINTENWDSLVKDLTSLDEFHVNIDTTPLGRANPFIPSAELLEKTKKSGNRTQ